ncbi:hypothetical protein CVD19_14185 [Bacillus sp. T33-2]|nr:hypothetical protein CVD19_14185 [Bacillus sp. T33-2]
MFEPKRLHPIAVVGNTFKQLKELVIPFLVFVVFGSKGTNWDLFYLAASVLTVIAIFVLGILSWYRFTYRIENGELRIEYGIFVRKKRYIPFERIQSLDVSEGMLQRLFGLVKVKVETAGSGGMGVQDGEAVLGAITRQDADFIHEYLVSIKKGRHEFSVEKQVELLDDVLYKISAAELLILASTSGGVGVVISAVFAFIFQFEEIIPYERIFKGLEVFAANGIAIIGATVFVGFFIAWLIALIGTMLKYADFTVRKLDNDLVITRGFLEKRQFTIPLNRIQAIRISENLIRQPLGLASAYVESAGGSAASEESAKVIILPVIKKQRIPGMLGPYLQEYQLEPDFSPAPGRALGRYLLRGSAWVIPVPVVALVFFRPWGYLALLLLAAAAFWAYLQYKDAGWSLDGQQLTLRYRTIIKTTVYMRKNKIQSLSIKESHFQRKKRLASVEATVESGLGGSGGKVIDIEKRDATAVYDWYSFTPDIKK